MSNNLIENKSEVFFTVRVKDGLFVKVAEMYGGDVRDVNVSSKEGNSYKFPNRDIAKKVALYVDGIVIKHTRTRVVTEVTEEVK